MNAEKKFRHEFKYICTENQLSLISERLKSLLKIDRHAGEKGIYQIRSLYFDDIYNTAYYDNENGIQPREKFRIRMYNQDTGFIRLELKSKNFGKTQKFSCPLTLEQTTALIKGEIPDYDSVDHPILRKLYILMKTRKMQPSVIVDYYRTPYIHRAGDARITLDRDICSSHYTERFFDNNIPKRRIMEAGYGLMEVKYNEFLTDIIYQTLNLESLEAVTFSKFYLCSKFNTKGF